MLTVRIKHDRANHTPETWPYDAWEDGEYMGESDVCFFAEPVEVTDESCRFPEDTITRLLNLESANKSAARIDREVETARGINKDQVLLAFGSLVSVNMKKRLSDAQGLYGDVGARVYAGTPGGRHKSLWNPVVLAVGLREGNSAPKHMLHRAFQDHAFLTPWWEEWKEIYNTLA